MSKTFIGGAVCREWFTSFFLPGTNAP